MSTSIFPMRVMACSAIALACAIACLHAPRALAAAPQIAIAAGAPAELADATDRAITMESFVQRSVIARDGSADKPEGRP